MWQHLKTQFSGLRGLWLITSFVFWKKKHFHYWIRKGLVSLICKNTITKQQLFQTQKHCNKASGSKLLINASESIEFTMILLIFKPYLAPFAHTSKKKQFGHLYEHFFRKVSQRFDFKASAEKRGVCPNLFSDLSQYIEYYLFKEHQHQKCDQCSIFESKYAAFH